MNSHDCLIEIRGAAGGEEAKIWGDDLLRMYLRFAQRSGWKAEIIDKGIIRLSGTNAFQQLKQEAGVHRVQRIPSTERYGRVHTSTATVAVLPIITPEEIVINPVDLEWQFYHASSHGGQNVQKVSTAARLTHKPTGIIVTCQTERFQEQNRKIALELLRAKLWEKKEAQRTNQLGNLRRDAVGQGMRCEKIRTYNFPQDRVTDHRIKKSWHNLEDILDGNLDKIVSAF